MSPRRHDTDKTSLPKAAGSDGRMDEKAYAEDPGSDQRRIRTTRSHDEPSFARQSIRFGFVGRGVRSGIRCVIASNAAVSHARLLQLIGGVHLGARGCVAAVGSPALRHRRRQPRDSRGSNLARSGASTLPVGGRGPRKVQIGRTPNATLRLGEAGRFGPCDHSPIQLEQIGRAHV